MYRLDKHVRLEVFGRCHEVDVVVSARKLRKGWAVDFRVVHTARRAELDAPITGRWVRHANTAWRDYHPDGETAWRVEDKMHEMF